MIEAALGVAADRRFPDAQLRRSADEGDAGPAALALYRRLCELASYGG